MDWKGWHDGYDRPGSPLSRRLRVVQDRIRDALAGCPPGPLDVVSVCAGQGRDLIEVLAGHPRRAEVRARLVELEPANAAVAAGAAHAAGLDGVEVVTGDASAVDAYRGRVPADLVLACGVFGNVSDEDIERTVAAFPQLCKTGGSVVWTRHRGAPDRVPLVCRWLEQRGFAPVWLSEPDAGFGVGAHRYTGVPEPLAAGTRMFTFVGYRDLPATGGVPPTA